MAFPLPPGLRMTEVQIDSSCLPPVQEVCRDFAVLEDGAFAYCLQEQEIEQHYASNVQRNQLVQKDLRVAKTLQAVEDGVGQLGLSQDQKEEQSKDRDLSLLLHPIQDEAQRKGPERPQRKERDQDHAQQMEEEEEEEEKVTQKERLRRSLGRPGTRTEPMAWQGGLDDGPQSPEQVRQDEELAWRLQEEEHAQAARARRNRERNDDYRVAQVAQDEEIARYIQDQELKERWKRPSKDPEAKGMRGWDGDCPESRDQEEETPQQKGGRAAPQVVRVTTLEKPQHPGKGSPTMTPTRPTQFCRNIAEELDPTFKGKGLARLPPAAEVTTTRSRVVAPVHPVPVDGLFDYADELAGPAFVSPTKRQPEKVGHSKPREKRDGGCKHQ